MDNKESVMSKDKIEALEKELENLKIVRRKEVAEKIKVARSFGDLSENSEYDEAKNEQAILEARIIQIENTLNNVKVFDENEVTTDKVGIYSTVKVRDTDCKKDETFIIVGSTESDPSSNKISDESPVGKALIGKGVGDKVAIEVPSGAIINYKIVSIGKPEF